MLNPVYRTSSCWLILFLYTVFSLYNVCTGGLWDGTSSLVTNVFPLYNHRSFGGVLFRRVTCPKKDDTKNGGRREGVNRYKYIVTYFNMEQEDLHLYFNFITFPVLFVRRQ